MRVVPTAGNGRGGGRSADGAAAFDGSHSGLPSSSWRSMPYGASTPNKTTTRSRPATIGEQFLRRRTDPSLLLPRKPLADGRHREGEVR
jgi:hypothetical protein